MKQIQEGKPSFFAPKLTSKPFLWYTIYKGVGSERMKYYAENKGERKEKN